MTKPHLTPSQVDALIHQARALPRRRLHLNLHAGPDEPCQRLVNAMEPDSYIPPHRHAEQSTNECLLALRGAFALILFDAEGTPRQALRLGGPAADLEVVELAPHVWHTVIALEPGSVLFEAKSGPYRSDRAKVAAPWAPSENHPEAEGYLASLKAWVYERFVKVAPHVSTT
ncbi:WbuC family cupin fold metalloprotein [Brevundimonas bacteroides]|uniref:WbuC family cupin fold metalloprotein n=1 Tax=Brevundimonas bacteroides TaxID=74311 RepID=UPI00054CDAB7|nr:WbuC family cupin fold metalloprotein [Brevundimonas bacteroides]